MANKYMTLDSGKRKLVEGSDTSSGVGSAGVIISANSSGVLDASFLPPGVGQDLKIAAASEDLSAGDFVNFWDDGGTVKIRKADASDGVEREAHGWVNASVIAPANAEVFFEGPNSNYTGLTPGARQYLSDTAGGRTETPATTGIHQLLGIAVDANTINTDIQDSIEL